MSSPLDARIRKLAREEAEGVVGTAPAFAPDAPGPNPVAELEQRLDALTARVDELAKAAADRGRRAPRKTTDTSE